MTDRPHVTIVHDRVGGPTGMGKVVALHASTVLEKGWRLTVVTSDLTTELPGAVVRLVPADRRLPGLLQHLVWMRGVRRVLSQSRSDLVHVHAPGLAPQADLLTSHYIAACARAHGVRSHSTTQRLAALRDTQERLATLVDDRFYRRLPERCAVSFVSEFLRDEFRSRYGEPNGGAILPPPAPEVRDDDPARAAARERFGAPDSAVVVGYLGGTSALKGFDDIASLAGHADVVLLAAGPGTDRVELAGRPGLGFVDIADLLPACDVLVAPSLFDSAPVSVLEALAFGVRPVVRPECGWARAIETGTAGVVWRSGPLIDAVLTAARIEPGRARSVARDFSAERVASTLIRTYEGLLR